MEEPFLCIITPVFDPCLKSLEGLITDLQKQSHGNFIHVSIANGKEPKIHAYIAVSYTHLDVYKRQLIIPLSS